jgi:hypothetical protein
MIPSNRFGESDNDPTKVIPMKCPVCAGLKKVLIAGVVPWPCGYCGGIGEIPTLEAKPVVEHKRVYREK